MITGHRHYRSWWSYD